MTSTPAVARFASQLRNLYEAAEKPDLATLTRQGRRQTPPVSLKDATLSDWLHGKTIPKNPESLRFLVQFLEGRSPAGVRRGPDWWEALRRTAWQERQAGRSSLPRTRAAAMPLYLRQVQRLAPEVLVDRDEELAELAAFCTRSGGSVYRWWQAPGWAGKSALLTWFVLHPPPGVRVVPFFITGRLAGQGDRTAFVEVVTEQLAGLLNVPLPAYLSAATQEAHLLDLLERAAPLVLVVDGLDEDLGRTASGVGHSVAALLPAVPPTGVRVLVAGRPDQPVPADVPDGHPLRDPAIVRNLAPSPHAQLVRTEAHRDLKRLLDGTPLQLDLLGLVTAAGGGLSTDDLADLTDRGPLEVADELASIAGRAFQSRTGPVFLAHEELQQSAVGYLGSTRLAGYRDRLHAWADRYAAACWPASTPDYLLNSYFRILQATGDHQRMVALATDPDRHDCLLAATGGDTAALTEISSVLEQSDLVTAARLAVHREHLRHRNDRLPAAIVGARATLGQLARADALAGAITAPRDRAYAMRVIAIAAARAGDFDKAERLVASIGDPTARVSALIAVAKLPDHTTAEDLLAQAIAAVELLDGPELRAQVLGELAVVMSRIGDQATFRDLAERAEQAARSVPRPGPRTHHLDLLADQMIRVGDLGRAEQLTRDSDFSYGRVLRLARMVKAVAVPTDVKPRLLNEAIAIASALADPNQRATGLAITAEAAIEADRPELGQLMIQGATQAAHSIASPEMQAAALVFVAGCHPTGAVELVAQAEALALTIDAAQRSSVLRSVAVATARSNVKHAVALAGSIEPADLRAYALLDIVGAALHDGDHSRARWVASQIEPPYEKSTALAMVAGALADAGQLSEAAALADEAEAIARQAVTDAHVESLIALSTAMTTCGDTARAAAFAVQAEPHLESFRDPFRDPLGGRRVIGAAVEAMIGCGEHDRAERLARSRDNDEETIVAVAAALVRAGEPDRAEAFVLSFDRPDLTGRVLPQLAEDLIASSPARAKAMIRTATAVATSPGVHDFHVARRIALALARLGEAAEAADVVGTISDPASRATTSAALAEVIGRTGDTATTCQLLNKAQMLIEGVDEPRQLADAYAAMALAAHAAGLHDRTDDLLDRAETATRTETDFLREQLLARIAVSAAKTGHPDRAERFTNEDLAPGWDSHARTLGDVVEALVDAGATEHAHRLAYAISTNHQFHVRTRLVNALARHGELDSAARVACSITDPDIRARALAYVAASTDPATARPLLIEALRSGNWFESVTALARIEPETAAEVADEFTTLANRAPLNPSRVA